MSQFVPVRFPIKSVAKPCYKTVEGLNYAL